MILFSQSTAVLHKYLNDKLKILCYNFSLRLHRISWVFDVQRNPRFSTFVATLSKQQYSHVRPVLWPRPQSKWEDIPVICTLQCTRWSRCNRYSNIICFQLWKMSKLYIYSVHVIGLQYVIIYTNIMLTIHHYVTMTSISNHFRVSGKTMWTMYYHII